MKQDIAGDQARRGCWLHLFQYYNRFNSFLNVYILFGITIITVTIMNKYLIYESYRLSNLLPIESSWKLEKYRAV